MTKADIVNEIHKNARKNFPRRHVLMKDIDDLWQADLIDMQSISKYNTNHTFILVVIDTFSKFAWGIPLKSKTKVQVSQAFKTIIETGRIPKNLQTDMGTEFYNDLFKSIVHCHKINHYSTYSTKKASIVERFIRTLKNKLYKLFSLKGNYKWVDGTLDNVINTYNHTLHRTVGLPPANINAKNKNLVLYRYNNINAYHKNNNSTTVPKMKVLKEGDFVRISKYKGTFEKGYTPNWSTEIFKITKVQNTQPITYLLEDLRQHPILGSFYTQELQKTKHPNIYLVEKIIKRKGNKMFVKWLGLPTIENSWIHKSNIL